MKFLRLLKYRILNRSVNTVDWELYNNFLSFFFSSINFPSKFFITRRRPLLKQKHFSFESERTIKRPPLSSHEFRTIQSSRRLIPRFRSLSLFTPACPVPRVAIHQSHAAAIQREIQPVVRTSVFFLLGPRLLPRRLDNVSPAIRPRSFVSSRFLPVLHPPSVPPHRDSYGVASRRCRTGASRLLRLLADVHLATDASRRHVSMEMVFR